MTHPTRIRIPGLIDVVLVSDPKQIRWLNQHKDVQRELDSKASWLHRLINRRLRGDLAYARGALPVVLNREDAPRAEAQARLHARLETLRGRASGELDRIAAFVAGDGSDIGAAVQQWCGRLFTAHYRATRESYEAGKLLASWPSAPPWRALAARHDGRLARAKRLIAGLADEDLHCIHATSIGMENITKTVESMRLAAVSGGLHRLSSAEVLRRCFAAPPAVLRGCKRTLSAPFLSDPLTPRSLIVLQLARAYARSGELDDAFLGNSWSECPAREIIPELLITAWDRAKHLAPKDTNWLGNIGISSRRWRARAITN